ncbi:efflux RND transporter periplasmic adaptor subunit [Ferrovibrio xuzhouensis]|uniref:Efflux RND transporter periplasmic adaptor subunit n=1 Tax=Ferrovibrio xuzhouensis TaxID=1576914 RepID=A0ABV7VA30_9PROT
MKNSHFLVVGVAATLTAAAAGYWAGNNHPIATRVTETTRPPAAISDTTAATATSPATENKPLYYRNPMGLPDVSPVPKKDSMGMDYIPVYQREAAGNAGTVTINPERVQNLGVRTEPAERRNLMRPVRASATVQFDERRQMDVTTKFEGWIEKLPVAATGAPVKAGQTLTLIYSPALVQAQEEYLIAKRLRDGTQQGDPGQIDADRLVAGALLRLRNLDVPKTVLDRLTKEGTVSRQIPLLSPVQGIVLEKAAVEGMRLMPGERLYRLVDDREVWVMADVFEQDLGLVKPGDSVNFTVNAYPGRRYSGRVDYIYPGLNAETRTAKVRIEVPNPDGALKIDMYATVELQTAAAIDAITVPQSAVLDTGNRQVVLVDRGGGRYEPREVQLGAHGDGYVTILQGLAEHEPVVVSANFLIDAESNIKAALSRFTEGNGNVEVTK